MKKIRINNLTKLICLLIIIAGVLLSGCIANENKINDQEDTGSVPNQKDIKTTSDTPTSTATSSQTSSIEEGVPTFKLGSWKIFSKDTTPKISIRFSTSETTTIDFFDPDGIPTDSVKYEIISKPSKMVGETIDLRLGDPLIIPPIGIYKLVATQNEKEVFIKEFDFKGPNVEVTRWEPHYKYDADGKLHIDYLNIFMKNNGDLPIYFKNQPTRLIAGGFRLTSAWYLKDVRVEPNTEIMIFSSEGTDLFKMPPSIENGNDELTIWMEDTSRKTYEFTTMVDPQKYID
jgi:hypothetical protein